MTKEINSTFKLPVFIPDNFHATQILEQYSFSSVKKRNLKACFYYILDTLYHMSQSREWRDEYEKNGGYPLHSSIMNNIMGKSYLQALTILEEQQVIVRSDSYQTGTQSKCVSLSKGYNSSEIKIREIDHNTPVAKNLMVEQQLRIKKNTKALKSIPYITKWFDKARIDIDCEELHVFIEFYRSELNKHLSANPQIKNKDIISSTINYKYNSMLWSVQRLLQGEMNLSKTGKDHRLHSFLSNIKKELRHLITYDGEALVSIDVKSCQPYLLTYLLQVKNWKKIVSLLSTYSISSSQIKLLHSFILMFGIYSKSTDSKGLQRKIFNEILWQDDFYLYIIKKAVDSEEQDVFPNKQKTKKRIINIFFDTGKYMYQNEARILFAQWFPQEAGFIEMVHTISRKLKATKSKGNDAITNLLPILLQRIESMIMLEHVCLVISEELPDAPLLPVHDCIHTTPQYAEQVRAIMERELTAVVGIKPGIKVEHYNKQEMLDSLEQLAREDWEEVLEKKAKKKLKTVKNIQNPVVVGVKTPLLMKIPKRGDKQIISTRYIDMSDIDSYN